MGLVYKCSGRGFCTINYGYFKDGKWVTPGGISKKLKTGVYTCNNELFGKDPFYDVKKVCLDGGGPNMATQEGSKFTVIAEGHACGDAINTYDVVKSVGPGFTTAPSTSK